MNKNFFCEKCSRLFNNEYNFNIHYKIHKLESSINWEEVQLFYDDNHTFVEIQKKYNLNSSVLSSFIKKGLLKTRTPHETMNLRGTRRIPQMTDEMKNKVSAGMRKAVLEGRQKTLKPYGSKLTIYYHKSWINNIEVLHGGWELKLAKYMDAKSIHWIKSKKHFTYIYEGKEHEYYPDFYLKDIDTYIEVKGYKCLKDESKWQQFPQKMLIIDKTNINNLDDFFIANKIIEKK